MMGPSPLPPPPRPNPSVWQLPLQQSELPLGQDSLLALQTKAEVVADGVVEGVVASVVDGVVEAVVASEVRLIEVRLIEDSLFVVLAVV